MANVRSNGLVTAYVNDSGVDWSSGGGNSPLVMITDGSDPTYGEMDNGEWMTFRRTFTGLPTDATISRLRGTARVSAQFASASAMLGYLTLPTESDQAGAAEQGIPHTGFGFSNRALSRFVSYAPGSSSVAIDITIKHDDPGWGRVTSLELGLEFTLPAPSLVTPNGDTASLTPTFQISSNVLNASGMKVEVRRVSDNVLMWGPSNFTAGTSRAYGGTTLAEGVTYKWRAMQQNASGHETEWSGYQNFRVWFKNPPTVSNLSPSGSVATLTPTMSWNYSDPDGDAQTHYQIEVRRKSDQVSMWAPGIVASSSKSVAYGGSTLSSGTAYEWRLRVTDATGDQSSFSPWITFTPNLAPGAPTLTSPIGLTNTLTPTIQGFYNTGLGGTEAAFRYQIRQGAVTIYDSGNVTGNIATGQAYGTNNSGDTPSSPPALAWGTSYQIRALSRDDAATNSEWTAWIAFNTNAAPTTPTSLSPNGATVGDTTPTLSWTHNDPDDDAQTEADIELRLVSDDSAVTGYDPKTLSQSTTTHDVTETLTQGPTDYKWRVRTKGVSGPGFGPWSEWTSFTVASAPVLGVTEPDPDEVITMPGFVATWGFSGGSGTQQSYRVRIYRSDHTTLVYDSGEVAGEATSHATPTGYLRNLGAYAYLISVKDTLGVESDSGFIDVTTEWTPPAAITVTVDGIGGQP